MKISESTYRELLRLFEHLAGENDFPENARADVDLLRSSIQASQDGAEIEPAPEIIAALKRLVGGKAGFEESRALISSARRFAASAAQSEGPPKKTDPLKIYENSPTLQEISSRTRSTDTLLAAFLLARRDKVAAENLKAMGYENIYSTYLPKLTEIYTVTDLAEALFAGGIFEGEIDSERILDGIAKPIDYFLKNRKRIEPEIRRLMNSGVTGPWHQHAKLSLFEAWGSNGNLITEEGNSIDAIVRWGNWIMKDPYVSLRSIFRGDEMAFAVITNHKELLELASADLKDRFEEAAWLAHYYPEESRQVAVEALGELIESCETFIERGFDFTEDQLSWLIWLQMIYSWNEDAAPGEENGRGKQGGGDGGTPSSGGGGKKPDPKTTADKVNLLTDSVEEPGETSSEEKEADSGGGRKKTSIHKAERSPFIFTPWAFGMQSIR